VAFCDGDVFCDLKVSVGDGDGQWLSDGEVCEAYRGSGVGRFVDDWRKFEGLNRGLNTRLGLE
jgi:hypothetical protein